MRTPEPVTRGSSELAHQLLATDRAGESRLPPYPVPPGHGRHLSDRHTQALAAWGDEADD